MTLKTEQEAFWAGDFGTEYIQSNQGDALLASNLDFWVDRDGELTERFSSWLAQ